MGEVPEERVLLPACGGVVDDGDGVDPGLPQVAHLLKRGEVAHGRQSRGPREIDQAIEARGPGPIAEAVDPDVGRQGVALVPLPHHRDLVGRAGEDPAAGEVQHDALGPAEIEAGDDVQNRARRRPVPGLEVPVLGPGGQVLWRGAENG